MVKRKRYRRKQYLIEKRFQMRYTGIILSVMFLTTFIAVYTTYYTSLSILGEKLANVYPQGRLIPILQSVNYSIVVRMLLVVPFLIVGSIMVSHRIAGPVYRIRRHLEGVGDGDLSMEVHLRKNDELKNLAETINKMQRKLKFLLEGNFHLLDKTTKELEKIKERLKSDSHFNDEEIKSLFKDTDKTFKDLNSNFSKFKIVPALED